MSTTPLPNPTETEDEGNSSTSTHEHVGRGTVIAAVSMEQQQAPVVDDAELRTMRNAPASASFLFPSSSQAVGVAAASTSTSSLASQPLAVATDPGNNNNNNESSVSISIHSGSNTDQYTSLNLNNSISNSNSNPLDQSQQDGAVASAAGLLSTADSFISMEGGRMWQAAADEAQARGRTMDISVTNMDSNIDAVVAPVSSHGSQEGNSEKSRRGPGSRLVAETFMERTRSRADPNALFADPKAKDTTGGAPHINMVRITKQDETLFLNLGLANKRVRVVQLLIIGLVATLLGWLGNFFVGTSCNFASVDVEVGENAQVFRLHFGLWKYSPADSAFNGYTYCYPYGGNHSSDVPIVPRISNLSALMAGTYSLSVLWWYLISGRVVETFWKWAVRSAIFAGAMQLSTLFFFVGRLCRKSSCTFGPASIVALVTAVAWFILAWELAYNMPAVHEKKEEPAPVGVANLEMADLHGASQEYYERFSPRGQSYQPPTIS